MLDSNKDLFTTSQIYDLMNALTELQQSQSYHVVSITFIVTYLPIEQTTPGLVVTRSILRNLFATKRESIFFPLEMQPVIKSQRRYIGLSLQ